MPSRHLPTLRYLGWEVSGSKAVYELERVEDKMVAVETERFTSAVREDLWLSDAILDHFGEDALDW